MVYWLKCQGGAAPELAFISVCIGGINTKGGNWWPPPPRIRNPLRHSLWAYWYGWESVYAPNATVLFTEKVPWYNQKCVIFYIPVGVCLLSWWWCNCLSNLKLMHYLCVDPYVVNDTLCLRLSVRLVHPVCVCTPYRKKSLFLSSFSINSLSTYLDWKLDALDASHPNIITANPPCGFLENVWNAYRYHIDVSLFLLPSFGAE